MAQVIAVLLLLCAVRASDAQVICPPSPQPQVVLEHNQVYFDKLPETLLSSVMSCCFHCSQLKHYSASLILLFICNDPEN